MNVFEAIEKRPSYRGTFTADPVPEEDLVKIMEAGLAAPSGCNTQTTSLIAVNDPAVIENLKAVMEKPFGKNAPAYICVLTQRIVSFKGKYCYAVQDYSAAIENMLLAMVELGYASCWYEGYVTDEGGVGARMAKVLGVPEGYEMVCVLPLGVPEKEPKGPAKKEFGERAWFNHFPE